jgi:hypothetical protein
MIAIETETGIFHLFSVFLAALYQEYFSLKILQTSDEFLGGAFDAQPLNTMIKVKIRNLFIVSVY